MLHFAVPLGSVDRLRSHEANLLQHMCCELHLTAAEDCSYCSTPAGRLLGQARKLHAASIDDQDILITSTSSVTASIETSTTDCSWLAACAVYKGHDVVRGWQTCNGATPSCFVVQEPAAIGVLLQPGGYRSPCGLTAHCDGTIASCQGHI